MKGYYEYCVEIWEEDINASTIYQGVTYGDSITEAGNNICGFYGEERIISVTLVPWSATGCLDMSEEALNLIKKEV